jgi:hypothetical protein
MIWTEKMGIGIMVIMHIISILASILHYAPCRSLGEERGELELFIVGHG